MRVREVSVGARNNPEKGREVAKVTGWISLCVTPWLKSYPTGPSGEQLEKVTEIASMLFFSPFPSKNIYAESVGLCVCVCVYVCVSMCKYLCVYMCVCAYMHISVCVLHDVCMCVSVCIFMFLCICVCVHAHTCACPYAKVDTLILTSLYYDFSGCLPFLHFSSCNSNSILQRECHSSGFSFF